MPAIPQHRFLFGRRELKYLMGSLRVNLLYFGYTPKVFQVEELTQCLVAAPCAGCVS